MERLENELCSFSNPSIASPTSQFILQPFFCFSYVTSSSLNSPGEPPMMDFVMKNWVTHHILSLKLRRLITEFNTWMCNNSPATCSVSHYCDLMMRYMMFIMTHHSHFLVIFLPCDVQRGVLVQHRVWLRVIQCVPMVVIYHKCWKSASAMLVLNCNKKNSF